MHKNNKSASRALDILELLALEKKPMALKEISTKLVLPKSSTFELLYTLANKGYLVIDDVRLKTFKLGIKTFQIGAAYIANTGLGVATPHLEQLTSKSKETTFLAVEDKAEVVYLNKVESAFSVRLTATLGSRSPMHCTALGKAMLAGLPDEAVEIIVNDKGLLPRTKNTITDLCQLKAELEAIRKSGFAIDRRENEEEVICVAAPVYSKDSKLVAAISISTLASRINNERLNELSGMVVDAALKISSDLGYLDKTLYCQGIGAEQMILKGSG